MDLGLCSGFFAEGTSLETAARRTRDLGLSRLALFVPGPVEPGGRDALRASGVEAPAIVAEGCAGAADTDFASSLASAVRVAAQLKAGRVVVPGGGFGASADRALHRAEGPLRGAAARGEVADPAPVVDRRAAVREEAALCAIRALHAALAEGVPIAIRNGGAASELLAFEETGWALDELEGLMLAFDPGRALRLARLGLGPGPEAWAERYANRTSLVFAHGLGSDLEGRSHPEDVPAPWGALAETLPRAAPWMLDVSPTLAAADVEDAVRYLAAHG